jgi:four helix bundle protein
MKIKRFEDLECWREARILNRSIYNLTKKDGLSKDYRLKDQIIGSGISVMNNIAEGFDSQSNNEFIRFLLISRRSVAEIETCLYIASDQNYISSSEFESAFQQSEKVKQVIDGFLRYLRNYRRSLQK